MASQLELKVLLTGLDKLTAPLKSVQAVGKASSAQIKELNEKLKELKTKSGQIGEFVRLKTALKENAKALKEAREKASAAAKALREASAPTATLTREFEKARGKVKELKASNDALQESVNKQRNVLQKAGSAMRELGVEKGKLNIRSRELTKQIDAEREKMAQANKQAKAMAAAQERLGRARTLSGNLAGASFATSAAGAVAGAPVVKAIRDYTSMETAMLGVARQVEGARDRNGQLTKTYYDMREEIWQMGRTIPMATTEIAALTEGGARMGIQGREELIAFTRTSAMSATAFDLPADQISQDMGKIANLYKIPIKNIEQLGDTLNWLDDNAQSNGADIINVMQRMGGVADKLNYKQAAALGSTFLSLGARPEVAASAANAMVRELSIATMQKGRFQSGLAAIGLDPKQLERDMTTDAIGTIQRVLAKVKQLNPEDQLRVTTQLFGKEYGDDAAKLANNLDELKRQIDLVNESQAVGSMGREASAKNDTMAARWLMMQNRLSETFSRLGETLRPHLVSIGNAFANVLDRINGWITANPKLAGAIMKVLAVVSALLVGAGALLGMLAAVIVPMAGLRYGLSVLQIQFGGAASVVTRLLPLLGRVVPIFKAIGIAFTSSPIGIAIAAIAVGALLIIKYWSLIKPFILGFLEGFKQGLAPLLQLGTTILSTLMPAFSVMRPVWDWFVDKLSSAWDWLVKLIAPFQATQQQIEKASSAGQILGRVLGTLPTIVLGFVPAMIAAGAALISGVIRGVISQGKALKDAVVSAASNAAQTFKQKLGINSPSRVFQQFGLFTMEGFERGIMTGQTGPIRAIDSFARDIIGQRMPKLDTRAPITARLAGAGSEGGIGSVNITINAAPGMDIHTLASLVGQEFDRRTRAAAARRRSSMMDID